MDERMLQSRQILSRLTTKLSQLTDTECRQIHITKLTYNVTLYKGKYFTSKLLLTDDTYHT